MRTLSLLMAGALLLAAAQPARALEAQLPGCRPGAALKAPADLPHEILLDVEMEYREDRAVRKTIRIVRGVPDRRLQRSALMSLDMSLGASVCPGIQRLRARVVIGPTRTGFEAVETEPAPGAIGQN